MFSFGIRLIIFLMTLNECFLFQEIINICRVVMEMNKNTKTGLVTHPPSLSNTRTLIMLHFIFTDKAFLKMVIWLIYLTPCSNFVCLMSWEKTRVFRQLSHLKCLPEQHLPDNCHCNGANFLPLCYQKTQCPWI